MFEGESMSDLQSLHAKIDEVLARLKHLEADREATEERSRLARKGYKLEPQLLAKVAK